MADTEARASLTDPDELLESPIPRPPRPQMTSFSEPPQEAPSSSSEEVAEEVTPEPLPPLQIPLSIALLQQTRRVRENLLPAWYAQFYLHGQDPAVAELLSTVNAMLSTADQAMMTQDVAQMRFIHNILANLSGPT